MENQNDQVSTESNDKDSQKYESNMKKLFALFSGAQAFKKGKIANKEAGAVIEELTKERKQKMLEEFKTKASKLLDNKVLFDKFVKEETKKFEGVIIAKKKEFNKEMEELFQFVENIEELTKTYETAFKSVTADTKS